MENPRTVQQKHQDLCKKSGESHVHCKSHLICGFVPKKTQKMGLSENRGYRGYPQIAIFMGNMVIIHWNMRYTSFSDKPWHVYDINTLWLWLTVRHGKIHHFLMGKSTISTGPFSIAQIKFGAPPCAASCRSGLWRRPTVPPKKGWKDSERWRLGE